MPNQFDGREGATTLPGISLIRADSMEVTNDPRMFATNVILKRLGAFHVVAVCAVLLGKLACTQMLKMESTDYEGIRGTVRYIAFCTMAMCFIADLSVAIIITIQLFHMTRLVTAGPTGFEISKTYYLNQSIVCMRHTGVKIFFFSIPVFILCMGATVYVQMGGRTELERSAPVTIMMASAAFALFAVNVKLNNIFKEKYKTVKAHEEPLLSHLKTTVQMNAHAGLDK